MKKHVPGTVDELRGLLTARKWEKAAYVWAFCSPQQGARTSGEKPRGYDFTSFAALGVTGLRNPDTVARYWHIWNDAIKAGHAKPTAPGREFDVPDLPWSEVYRDDATRPARPRVVKPGERRGDQSNVVGLPKRDAESLVLGMLDDLNHFQLLRVQMKITAIMSVRAHQDDEVAETK